MENSTKAQKLKKLLQQLKTDAPQLPLAQTAADIIPPEGCFEAKVMFIGEAAGYHEYLQKRPFVGAAGKLLTESLSGLGIKRQEVWITNILKVRPPQNRDPKTEEIQAFNKYLDAEIKIIEPKLIVTLGRFSMAKFIPNAFISRIHGQARWVDWQQKRLLILPLYHPAAALRNPHVMELFRSDFKKISQILERLEGRNQEKQEKDKPDIQDPQAQAKVEQQLQLI